jgi:hypothetical protein
MRKENEIEKNLHRGELGKAVEEAGQGGRRR